MERIIQVDVADKADWKEGCLDERGCGVCAFTVGGFAALRGEMGLWFSLLRYPNCDVYT